MKKKMMTLAAVLCCAMMSSVFIACSDNDDNPTPVNPPSEMAEYTILFYGHGGNNLDAPIMYNIQDFFNADESSYKKVNIAVQYKFSTEDGMTATGYIDDADAEKWSLKTIRFVGDNALAGDAYDWLTDDMAYGEDNCEITNPDSLTNFINWAAKVCPAKHYVLIISDHGGSYMPHEDLPYKPSTRAVVFDDGHDEGVFSVSSLAAAIRNADIRPQVIYMDACMMNTVEYQFELKDLCDYYVASTFTVPAAGGEYTSLVNLLAQETDVEKKLADLVESNIERWSDLGIFNDITATRMDKLDDFGVAMKAFTDKLVEAYQSGDQAVVDAIDDCTEFAFKIDKDRPSYDLIDCVNALCDALPDVFSTDLRSQVINAYEASVVKAGCSQTLAENNLSVELSVLMGFDNTYISTTTATDSNGVQADVILYHYSDGRRVVKKKNDPDFIRNKTWGSTFDATYKQLKFDKVVGWSRWIEVNQQVPCQDSPVDWDPGFFQDVIDYLL